MVIMMKKLFLIMLLATLLVACTPEGIPEEKKEMPDGTHMGPPLGEQNKNIPEDKPFVEKDITILEDVEVTDINLIFYPDTGYRMDDASNPGAKVNDDGTVSLLYEDRLSGPGEPLYYIATSDEGLEFDQGEDVRSPSYFRALELSDGIYRAYGQDATKTTFSGLTSESADEYSFDGSTFTEDEDYRYELQDSDEGTMGVYDLFVDPEGNVVLLYIGNMFGHESSEISEIGVNNVRRAYSTDNGWTFQYDRGNVLDDAIADYIDEEGNRKRGTYVDQRSLVLSDGDIRLLTMRGGNLYSFISEDGDSFEFEPGVRLKASDFTEFDFVSLHDPQMVELPDGRYRIYVCGNLGEEAGYEKSHQMIVSATTKLE